MLDNIIKILSISFCSIYIFRKITNKTSLSSFSPIRLTILSLLLSTLSILLNVIIKELTYLIPFIIFWIAISVFSNQPQRAFITVSISFNLSIGIYFFVSFISTIFMYMIYSNKETFPYTLLAIISSLFQFISAYFLCKIKRFQSGLPLLKQHRLLNIATIACVVLSITLVYLIENHNTSNLRGYLLFSIIITLIVLIFWWQAQITKSYRKKMELRDKESKRIADLEREILLQKALKENERLARISHRDNTLITTLKNATVNYLYTEYSDPEEARKAREELIANIEALSAGRAEAPENYNQRQARHFDTKLSLMNKLLHQMDSDALNMNITFSVHFGVMLEEFVPSTISEIDLVHIVDDLLKNAFKATKNSEPRMVQLQFYNLGKHFVVEVADNGIPFEVRSLVNMGIEKLTTYEDGSGIGLMDIWSAKEKYRATYHLDEYVTATPFSKKISLTFDKKNRYSIRTFRKNEILQMSRRADLQVYDDDK